MAFVRYNLAVSSSLDCDPTSLSYGKNIYNNVTVYKYTCIVFGIKVYHDTTSLLFSSVGI